MMHETVEFVKEGLDTVLLGPGRGGIILQASAAERPRRERMGKAML
jgi:hypothetical protein